MPARRALLAAGLMLGLAPLVAGCLPQATIGSLGPTLRFADVAGGRVPMEHGIVVPTFEIQPRPRIDLDGPWRVDPQTLDDDISLTDRSSALPAIEAAAAGRQAQAFDDSRWPTVPVPGTFDPPPHGGTTGAWYRRHVAVPSSWSGSSITLKFGAANYVADVWLNGSYLGVHEGGATPFAFDATPAVRAGEDNVVAVRVANPPPGTRADMVPWGLIDWWSYGGLTGSVWLEASGAIRAARADIVPHLDGADVSVVVENRGPEAAAADVRLDVFPAVISPATLLDPRPSALLPPLPVPPTNPRLPPEGPGAIRPAPGQPPPPERLPVATASGQSANIPAGGAVVTTESLLIPDPMLWDLGDPNLYVLQVTVTAPDGATDTLVDTFGLRRIAVDSTGPRLLLNGRTVELAGVAVHDEVLRPAAGTPGATATAALGRPLSGSGDAIAQLRRAQSVGANFVRTGHEPADPAVLRLADRLGIAIWEEIPVYHFTPHTFEIAETRGIARQLIQEMALRDMNRASVLFHGVSNESTGGPERTAALKALRDADRDVDGTRLVGQAAYGFDAADGTSEPLDVVGITSYFGVFYGEDARADTAVALDAAHQRYPKKPVMILEFGHWADTPADEAIQSAIFRDTYAAIAPRRDTLPDGFVGSVVWWSLEDYLTSRPGITVERFGLFGPDGARRPVASLVAREFAALDAGTRPSTLPPTREPPEPVQAPAPPVTGLIVLAVSVALGGPLAVLALLAARGHRRSRHVRAAARPLAPGGVR
ncbi:MAG TPA: glycoside hydrolase family 2 TIM barrel-domain containing protein [Candidatus Limnocylindrales bacterium]